MRYQQSINPGVSQALKNPSSSLSEGRACGAALAILLFG
jgi:hypothetical protein